jgi:hypothetical protein
VVDSKEALVRTSWICSAVSALVLALPAAAAGPVVYDFHTPAAEAALHDDPSGTLTVGGIPLEVEAGLLDHDGHFTPAAAGALLQVLPIPVPNARGAGLGVLSDVPSLSFPEEGLSMEEGLVFHFAPGFRATRLTLSDFTQGPDDFGEGAFEAVRLFADGAFLADVPGADGGEVTILLPPGIHDLALTPLLQETSQIPNLSSDPVFYVAAIAGTAGREVAFDVRPASCPNPLNTRSHGVLPAALLGAPDLDAAAIDPASIRLLGLAPRRAGLADVAGPVLPLTGRTACGAARRDGRPDLTLDFDIQALTRALQTAFGPLRDGQVLAVPIEARLRDGTPLVGEDLVRLQVPGKKR